MTVDIPVVKYIFVVIATASAACVYPVIWPGKGICLSSLGRVVADLYSLERIRAARGTTTAGLAIGMTNVCFHSPAAFYLKDRYPMLYLHMSLTHHL